MPSRMHTSYRLVCLALLVVMVASLLPAFHGNGAARANPRAITG